MLAIEGVYVGRALLKKGVEREGCRHEAGARRAQRRGRGGNMRARNMRLGEESRGGAKRRKRRGDGFDMNRDGLWTRACLTLDTRSCQTRTNWIGLHEGGN